MQIKMLNSVVMVQRDNYPLTSSPSPSKLFFNFFSFEKTILNKSVTSRWQPGLLMESSESLNFWSDDENLSDTT